MAIQRTDNPHHSSRVTSWFSKLSRFAIAHPRSVLLAVVLVTLAALPGLARLKLRTDGHALVTPDAPEVLYDSAIRQKFGIEDQIVVLLHSTNTDGIFNPATLQRVRNLTAEFLKLPGVSPASVMSLATEPSFRLRPSTLIHQTCLEPRLETKVELDQLRDDLRRIQLYTGTLVSASGQSTVILIGTPSGCDRTEFYRDVLRVIAARGAETTDEIVVTGAPVAESLLGIHILEDLGVPKSLLGGTTLGETKSAGARLPQSLHELRLLIARRIGLVPLAALVMMLILLLAFRNLLAMLLPLPGVVATLLFVFGLMGWSGVPIYLTIAVMPVLLTTTGVINDVYLFSRYFSLLRERQPKGATGHVDLVKETFDNLASPVAITSLTTAIGFLSFGFSPLRPVQAFGICSCVGALFGLLYSLTVVPAMLTLAPPHWLVRQKPKAKGEKTDLLAAWFSRLAETVVRRRWWVAGAALVIAILTPLGLRRLIVQDSWTNAFDPGSEFHHATQLVNEEFYGMHLLHVSFDLPETLKGELKASDVNQDGFVFHGGLVKSPVLLAGSPITVNTPAPAVWRSHIEMVYSLGTNIGARIPREDMGTNWWEKFSKAGPVNFEVIVRNHFKPEVVRAIGDLSAFIRQRSQYAVGGVLGPADYVATTRFMARPNDPTARVIPEDPAEIKLMWDYYGLALGQKRLHQIVDTNYWQSLTTVFLKDANFVATGKLMKEIRDYEREHLTPKGIKLGFAGDVALSQSLIGGIVTTQMQSMIWSLVGILLATSLLGGSLRWGLYSVLPSLLAVIVKLGVMGWLGVPLGVATSMFAAMTFGIGVNCAIQLLESYRQAQAQTVTPGQTTRLEDLKRAMALTGPPALINTIAVSLGFSVLMLSQVPADARLGLLMVLGLTECFLASLLLLPLFLHWWPVKKN